jgi:G3E family GTPase
LDTSGFDLHEAIDIEKQLTVSDNNSMEAKPVDFVPLANGCICCSVKDVGVAAIENLMESQGGFDYILLETTGLADPGNIAPLFWLDDGLGSSIFLDGIVTLVDAKNILRSLDDAHHNPEETEEIDHNEERHEHGPHLTTAHLQISHADVIIVNKADLVSAQELNSIINRIRSINGLARIETTTRSRVSQLEGTLLDLHAYDQVSDADLQFASKGHSHLDPVGLFCKVNSTVTLIQRRIYQHQPSLFPQSASRKSMSSTSSCVPCYGKKSYQAVLRTRLSRFTV